MSILRFFCFSVFFVCLSVLLMTSDSSSTPIADFQKSLPEGIMGWKAEAEDRFFDATTIFDYIDGAGEVYRAYNMRGCLSRRYVNPDGPAMMLDIFDMGSSKDAFGVFTHDQDGDVVRIGQGALYRPGWLSFWKDRFFVSIYMEAEMPATEEAVKGLGKAVASVISGNGIRPEILSFFPLKGIKEKSIRYLHHPVLLNYHFYLADENILNIGPETDTALAAYRRGEDDALLLLVGYPKVEQAVKGRNKFLRHYLPDADSRGAALLEDGKWSGVSLDDKLLVVVLDATTRNLLESLIEEVKRH